MLGMAGRLFAHYRTYHLHGPLMLRYLSILGFVAFPAFYLLRFTKPTDLYDDLVIRVIDAALCVVLFLKERWPQKLRRYYFAYSYVVLIVTLPLTFVFTSLKQQGGTVAVGNTLLAVFLVILLTDWRNTIVVLVAGFGVAIAAYIVLDPDPRLPLDYVLRLPILLAVVIGGSLFKFAAERATAGKVRHAYASLAASIAHEMRNPLGQVKHALDRMQEALPPPSLHAQTGERTIGGAEIDALYRHLADSEIAVRRGLQVISMTLDEVNTRPMDSAAFSFVSAGDATDKAVREYGYDDEADRQRVRVRVVDNFDFRGDETAYLFVIFNLLKNALYYAAGDPAVTITITVSQGTVTVHDTGPGMSTEAQALLFQPFSSVGKSGGTGLGLAYCQRVMQAFGGKIECTSVEGSHTRFTLTFPVLDERAHQAHREAALGRARMVFEGRRLLVVDDDMAQRLTTRHKLLPLGARVDEAADGQRALEMLSRDCYDLVLLDLNMPVLDGYAVAERIRRGHAPASRSARIVAYTSEPAHLASVKTHRAGMDGFVNKPAAQLALVQALQYVLERDDPTLSQQTDLASRHVLVADDNAVNRKTVAAWLRHAGVTVTEASNGNAVLEQLRSAGPWDAVLLDIHMPGMSGIEVAAAVRAGHTAWTEVPLVALTASSGQDAVATALAAGFNDFLAKPVESALLYATLRRLAGARPAVRSAGIPAAHPEEVASQGPLLDHQRLESYRRIGMLDELLDDYVAEIGRLAGDLRARVAQGDLQACTDTLHSLLGISGEAGAAGLYRYVRSVYVPMVEERAWPTRRDWAAKIDLLAEKSQAALRDFGATTSGNPTP